MNPKQKYRFRITIAGYVTAFLVIFLFAIALIISAKGFSERVNLIYAIIAVALSLFIVSAYIGFLNIRNIEITRILPSGITAEDVFDIWLRVYNTSSFLPKMGLRIVDKYVNAQRKSFDYEGYCITLGSKKLANMIFSLSLSSRGLYKFDEIKVTSSFPFGISEFSTTIKIHDEILIYPKIAEVKDITKSHFGLFTSAQKNLTKGSTFHDEYFGVREYNPGDSMKYIHWKLSAKTQNLLVREYLEESFPPVVLILDSYIIKKDKDLQALETAISVVAGLAKKFSIKGWRIALIAENNEIFSSSGHQHYLQILKALALFSTRPNPKPLKNTLSKLNLKKYNNHIAYAVCLRDREFYDFSEIAHYFKSIEIGRYKQFLC